jgi:hypothetical protein
MNLSVSGVKGLHETFEQVAATDELTMLTLMTL